jgi:hypothetical protein
MSELKRRNFLGVAGLFAMRAAATIGMAAPLAMKSKTAKAEHHHHHHDHDHDDYKGGDPPSNCFMERTRLLTEGGYRPIERLTPGDMVMTLNDGAMPILSIELRLSREPPIKITEGALDEGRPMRDLFVSPDHALLIDGQLIPAKFLVNHISIIEAAHIGAAHYYHIKLAGHQVVFAEGVAAETLRIDGEPLYTRLRGYGRRDKLQTWLGVGDVVKANQRIASRAI